MAATASSTLTVAVIGWFVIPIISFYVNKLLSYLNLPEKNRQKLKYEIIPSLEEILEEVTEQRMLRATKDEGKGSESDLKTLGELENDLKFQLYDIGDFLDLIKYHQIEKKVISGDGKSVGTSVSSFVLQAIGDCIACCKRSSFGQKVWLCVQNLNQKLRYLGEKLQQCALDLDQKFWGLVAKLQQCAQDLHLKCWDFVAKIQQYAHAAQYMLRNGMFRFRDHALRDALRTTLVQYAQRMNMYNNHQGATGQPPQPDVDDVEQGFAAAGQTSMPDAPAARSAAESRDGTQQGSATTSSPTPYFAPTNPASSNALLIFAGSATQFRGNNQHGSAEAAPPLGAIWNSLGQMIYGWLVNRLSALRSLYLSARELRDWSHEIVGIKNDDGSATDWVLHINEIILHINEIISLKKKIKDIEYIVSYSKNSPLLNKSGRSTPKDADKESSSSKNSAEASSSTQKEVDDLHRHIDSRDHRVALSRQEVLGREDDRKHISMMLRNGPDTYAASSSTSKSYSVIGIHGVTGSGKSTLAQYVCYYEKKARHFNPVMFIHVGKTFNVGAIFRDMLEQITLSRPPNDEGLKSLKTKLEKTLTGKRFLLVLDDLWVNDDNHQKDQVILLDMLRLSGAMSGSRVLVTAQKTDAAEALGAHLQPFSIPDLEEEVYLSLLMHHAGPFATNDDYRKYERIGRKIAKRLSSSPIAAVTVGRQLKKKSISFWETTAELEVLNETMGALWWSCRRLAVDVRRCFTYCCIFPKGYAIERDEMVRMWIAQGFVNTRRSNATVELEDVGQRYFDELLSFSFLQAERTTSFVPKKWRDYDMIFRIHDLLHELAERVSGSEFYRIGLNGLPKDIPQGVHHLSIETNNVAEIVEKILDLGNLRTLIIKEPYGELVDSMERILDLEEVLGRLFMRLRKLRVLTIRLNYHRCELSVSVPVSIYHMKHLRYLRFVCYAPGVILPSTFSKLYHIQSIDISQASYPEGMANLICLRHISGWLSRSIPNIGRLTSLQRLPLQRLPLRILPVPLFEVKQEQGYELKQLMHLNKLRGNLSIQGLEFVGSKEEALQARLMDKERLQRLKLNFGSSKRFGPDVEAKVLEGLCPPKDLHELHIKDYRGSRYPSWILSPHHPDAPTQVHKLQLTCCSQLASIPEDSKFFTGLRELKIYKCDWDILPENMERLRSLEKISIIGCPVLSKTCKEEGHENWHKIEHIPVKLCPVWDQEASSDDDI